MRILGLSLLCTLVAASGSACLEREAPLGPKLTVRAAALTLEGPDDVCYDILVENAQGPVWSRGNPLLTALGADQTGGSNPGTPDADTVCSTRFGNSAGGDVTYIGTCDADSDSDASRDGVQNRVTLWVDGLYKSGADLGDWQDPCDAGCALSVDCNENQDSLVEFNLTLMRQANQGFFDVAVNFEDVFCSAKLDTCYQDGADADADDDPIRLIHGGDAVRDWTGVFGFACTAGDGPTSSTTLMYSRILVTCGTDVFEIDPKVPTGNASVTASDKTLHYAVYRGTEALECAQGSCNKVYWNLAVSVDDLASFGGTCTLTLSATATDGDGGFTAGLPTAVGQAYPYIDVDTDLTIEGVGLCQRHAVNQSDAVKTTYRGTIDGLGPPTAMYHRFDGASVGGTGADGGNTDILCGNAVVDTSEQCDSTVPGSHPHNGPNWCIDCACQSSYLPNGLGGCDTCGDGIVNGPEDCEASTEEAYLSGCLACLCTPGTTPNPAGAELGCVPVPFVDYCGNGILGPRSSHQLTQEECDNTVPGAGGDPSDCLDCECRTGTGPDGTGGCVNQCGNGIQNAGEDCDGGLMCQPDCSCPAPWVDHFGNNGCYCDGGPAECGG